MALRADRPESHAGYQRHHASTFLQPEQDRESDAPDTDTEPQPPPGETLINVRNYRDYRYWPLVVRIRFNALFKKWSHLSRFPIVWIYPRKNRL